MHLFGFGRRSSTPPEPENARMVALRSLATSAVAADEARAYAEALELYTRLIQNMLELLPGIPDQDSWKKKIEGYITRAEQVKALAVPPPTTSSLVAQNDPYAHMILDEVLDKSPGVHWDDIAGLSFAKQTLQEAIVLPTLRPDLFTGLCSPPKGALLFGPPGTGKTMLAKAIATEAKATFFSITASTLTSKWMGEGEKLVRALFEMARELQPSVIFMDEIDAVLSARAGASEHEASRRLKNQFLVQMDGVASRSVDRVLVLGATNLPFELDEALLRRLEKRIYVPLPDPPAREALLLHALKPHACALTSRDIERIVRETNGFSGSDVRTLCKEAAMGPLRSVGARLAHISKDELRPIAMSDFTAALNRVRPSVSEATLGRFDAWNDAHGAAS
ncbi:hypothetical protein SPRG_14094 [Saprolegnia parasitica CBS 223.65]|uniref:microtubule-severing ATPase n=1 Tax=Saprolegnia parasitica (strain CBS 223.65) TaxID=695850 RepID=A0A067BRI0_SAPPC|nr:hypothetical protein SPRG_14094 [Saprolegnia parasitica CBS 223.65]KDO20863.1 hypothetical protein SPRG_14094 [Saprolegnia parasitica CBS 223.65]|eukprot:XP_012208441.1 hypothetical protein SPRG_14094 [Saprolegnia parasitica CBS 223.65]